jgi:1,4-dihydroxy-2-naphthoate octaprenyltransferase
MAWLQGIATGCLACALLVINNLRDIPTDRLVGKRTLAVRLGDQRTRVLFITLILLGIGCGTAAAVSQPWSLIVLLCLFPAIRPLKLVRGGASGRELIAVLGSTGQLQIVFGALTLVSFLLSN